jgi:Ner family transcriptional regulator
VFTLHIAGNSAKVELGRGECRLTRAEFPFIMSTTMTKLDASKKPAHQDWHRADIKAALEKRGLSLARLARLNGYARSSAPAALHFPWPRMERLIATAIGVAPQEIWPSRYNEKGQPNRPMGRPRKSDGTDSIMARNDYVQEAA